MGDNLFHVRRFYMVEILQYATGGSNAKNASWTAIKDKALLAQGDIVDTVQHFVGAVGCCPALSDMNDIIFYL
jgi:hypothetical protein